jgi:plasmid maintenance system antidote protein VapI
MQDDKARKSARLKIRERYRRSVGAVLGTAIRESPKNQSDVARDIGVSEDTMTDIVLGRRKVELGDIVLIARSLDTDPAVLVRRMLNW